MPEFKLKNILIERSDLVEDFKVATIPETDSGWMGTRVINTESELDAYGDLKYRNMFLDLLEYSNLIFRSPISLDNRSTLRFNDDSDLPYCSPIYGEPLSFSALPNVTGSRFYDPYFTYGYRIIFDDRAVIEIGDYIVIPRTPDKRDVFIFSDSTQITPPISSTYIDDIYYIDITNQTLSDIISLLSNEIGSQLGYLTTVDGLSLEFRTEDPLEVIDFHKVELESNGYVEPMIKMIPRSDYENHLVAQKTFNSRICQFNSKILGSEGENISLTIIYLNNDTFELDINYSGISEKFIASTSKIFGLDGTFLYLSDVVKSELVDVEMFNDGGKLQEGTFYLSNSKEVTDLDIDQALSELGDEDWSHFDIIILEAESEVRLNNIKDLCIKKDTMSFLMVKDLLANPLFDVINTDDNRMIYFYGELEYKDDIRPMYYPYIVNFLSSTFIDELSEDILHYELPDDIKSLCIDKDINYVDYNNLEYFYLGISASSNNMNVIHRFILSKINRTFLENDISLIGVSLSGATKAVSKLVGYLRSTFPLISSLKYELNQRTNTLDLTLITTFSGLSFKRYSVQIIIKI